MDSAPVVGMQAAVVNQLCREAATVEVGSHVLPATGFLISVPRYSLAGRGDWSHAEVADWWRQVEQACTEPRAWFAELGVIRGLGAVLDVLAEESVLYAGTWTDQGTKWLDANLYIRGDLIVEGRVDLKRLHPPTVVSPASVWSRKRSVCRTADALDVAFAVGRRLHQAAVWELDAELPEGGRSWPVWY
ncbi:hypothetical protein ACFY36_50475 [Actinoplanes sp. NPDC000266]